MGRTVKPGALRPWATGSSTAATPGWRAARVLALGLGAGLASAAGAWAASPPAADATLLSLEQLLDIPVLGASKYAQKQRDVAAAVRLLTRQDIARFGWQTLDEALNSLPGVHTTYDRQYTYFGLRGLGLPGDYNTRVLVTINGNRVNDPAFDSGPLGRQFPLDMALIDRIELLPGPGSAVYGQNAMLGVVNVVTRQGADLAGAEVELQHGRLARANGARASWGRRLDSGLDLLLSVSALRARGADQSLDFGSSGIRGTAVGMDGERSQQFYARIAQGRWSAEHLRAGWRKDDPTGAYQSDPLVPGQYQGDAYALTQLQFDTPLDGDAWQLSVRLFAGEERYSSVLRYGSSYRFPSGSAWHGAELRLLTTALQQHKLMLGLEGQRNRRVEQTALSDADPAADLRINSPGHRLGLYLQDEWRLGEAWSATLGLRLDRDDRGNTTRSPRAALIWRAGEATTLKALLGRGHRAPNAYERDYGDGLGQLANPALRGERIDTLELVAEHQLDHRLALQAAAWGWSLRNPVVLATDAASGIAQYQSGRALRARGLELSADRSWPGGVRLRAGLALQDVGGQDGARLANSPRALLQLKLSAPLPWAGLQAGLQWQAESARRALDGSLLGRCMLAHLQLQTAALAPGLTLQLGLRNLFDRVCEQPAADTNWQTALAQDGRSLRLGLGLKF